MNVVSVHGEQRNTCDEWKSKQTEHDTDNMKMCPPKNIGMGLIN